MAKYTALFPGIANGTTADGGQVRQELDALGNAANDITNDQINSAANIAISKTALGTYTAWTDFTPTIYKNDNSTAWTSTIGESRYTQIGKTVIWSLMFIPASLANTGAFAYITLPVAAKSNATYNRHAGSVIFQWTSNATVGWPAMAYLNAAGDRIYIGWASTYNNGTVWSDTVANPYIYCKFTYEAA